MWVQTHQGQRVPLSSWSHINKALVVSKESIGSSLHRNDRSHVSCTHPAFCVAGQQIQLYCLPVMHQQAAAGPLTAPLPNPLQIHMTPFALSPTTVTLWHPIQTLHIHSLPSRLLLQCNPTEFLPSRCSQAVVVSDTLQARTCSLALVSLTYRCHRRQ